MRPRVKAAKIQNILDELHPSIDIPLTHRDPYTLLVAVILSAQCTDKRVNQVTPQLFSMASTAAEMKVLPVGQIESTIRSCGLAPTKAKNISALSKILVETHGGRVPDTFEELESLPGVGHKTASVVMSQAFGKPAFPVDTHVHRLAARWGLSSGKNVKQTEQDLKTLFPENTWGRVHLQMVTFGRQHCPARGHDPSQCPICNWASADGKPNRRKTP